MSLIKCEEDTVKDIMVKLKKVHDEENVLKTIAGSDRDLLTELDKEDKEVREIKKAYDEVIFYLLAHS